MIRRRAALAIGLAIAGGCASFPRDPGVELHECRAIVGHPAGEPDTLRVHWCMRDRGWTRVGERYVIRLRT